MIQASIASSTEPFDGSFSAASFPAPPSSSTYDPAKYSNGVTSSSRPPPYVPSHEATEDMARTGGIFESSYGSYESGTSSDIYGASGKTSYAQQQQQRRYEPPAQPIASSIPPPAAAANQAGKHVQVVSR